MEEWEHWSAQFEFGDYHESVDLYDSPFTEPTGRKFPKLLVGNDYWNMKKGEEPLNWNREIWAHKSTQWIPKLRVSWYGSIPKPCCFCEC